VPIIPAVDWNDKNSNDTMSKRHTIATRPDFIVTSEMLKTHSLPTGSRNASQSSPFASPTFAARNPVPPPR
jgi:hypothetical protein